MIICTHGHVFDKDLLPKETKEGLNKNTDNSCLIKDCYGKMIECDDMLVPAIVEFNKNGYSTAFSCSGHYGSPITSFYVAFKPMSAFEIFNMVADIIYLSKTEHIEVDYFDIKIFRAFYAMGDVCGFKDLVYKIHMSDVYEYDGQDIATKVLKPLKMAMTDNGADFQMIRPLFSLSIDINLEYIGYDNLKETFDECRDVDCMKLLYDSNMQMYKLASALKNVGAMGIQEFKEEFLDDELRNWHNVLMNEKIVKTFCVDRSEVPEAVDSDDDIDDDDLEDDDLIESLVMKPVDDFDRDCDDDDDDYDELDPESPLLSKIDNAIKKLNEEGEDSDKAHFIKDVKRAILSSKHLPPDPSIRRRHVERVVDEVLQTILESNHTAKKVPVKKKTD